MQVEKKEEKKEADYLKYGLIALGLVGVGLVAKYFLSSNNEESSPSKKKLADIGLIGLAVMGENLVLNMESRGFTVAVNNRSIDKVDKFIQGRGKGKNFIGCHTIEELAANLKKPRKAMIMVRAGSAVDDTIKQILPYFEKGDIIIDGGNSNFKDTNRRCKELEEKGILFIGTGVSGGEEGALTGPSIMPGGSEDAWQHVKPIFQAISAKVENGQACCDWVGKGGSGHYVKMVHNGIEYGDMQLISEAAFMMKHLLGFDNEKIAETFTEWNKGLLDSYLIEITAEIFRKKDEEGKYIVDLILDCAGQKGTGKWTAKSALDFGMPVTLIAEAVFARCLSSLKEERQQAEKLLPSPEKVKIEDVKGFLKDMENALYASKLVSYAQGFILLKAASEEFKWDLHYGSIALMWRGGCIIRSKFLAKIKEAYDNQPQLKNLLADPFFLERIKEALPGWRRVASASVLNGIPAPTHVSALSYFDGYRIGNGSANVIQAQRDYFGAHTYERVDKPRGQVFHTNWTGRGGDTTSTNYNFANN